MEFPLEALPERFDFYHLGEVRMESRAQSLEPALVNSNTQCVAFAIQGGARGAIAILFHKNLDHSTYTELGNILASQAADRLAKMSAGEDWLPVLISPPKSLNHLQFGQMLALSPGASRFVYNHVDQGQNIPIQVIVMPALREEIAHA